jgi:hypothetical protein
MRLPAPNRRRPAGVCQRRHALLKGLGVPLTIPRSAAKTRPSAARSGLCQLQRRSWAAVLCHSLCSSTPITTTPSGHLRGRRAPETPLLTTTTRATSTVSTWLPPAPRPARPPRLMLAPRSRFHERHVTISSVATASSSNRDHRALTHSNAILVSRSLRWSVTRPASVDLFGSAAITSAAAVSSSSSAAAPAEPRFQPQSPDPAARPVHQPRQSATLSCSTPPRTPSRVRTTRPRPRHAARPVSSNMRGSQRPRGTTSSFPRRPAHPIILGSTSSGRYAAQPRRQQAPRGART